MLCLQQECNTITILKTNYRAIISHDYVVHFNSCSFKFCAMLNSVYAPLTIYWLESFRLDQKLYDEQQKFI